MRSTHVPQADAADRLSKLVSAAESVPRLRPVSGHVRDTIAETEDAAETKNASVTDLSEWARLDSNQGPMDYET